MSAQQTVSSNASARVGQMLLRVATPADAAALSRAAATFFLDTFGDANRREDIEAYLASAFSQAKQHEELVDADNRIWLAIAGDGDIAGYAHVRRSATPSGASITRNHAVEIARIYAGQQWQGRGLGIALMDQCVATAKEWGGDVLWLGVWERNSRAIEFYQKRGFQTVGEQPFLLGTDLQRDLVMARRLGNGG
jgi:ribosomal protein S18 acetylase RimI-like enzyme